MSDSASQVTVDSERLGINSVRRPGTFRFAGAATVPPIRVINPRITDSKKLRWTDSENSDGLGHGQRKITVPKKSRKGAKKNIWKGPNTKIMFPTFNRVDD